MIESAREWEWSPVEPDGVVALEEYYVRRLQGGVRTVAENAHEG